MLGGVVAGLVPLSACFVLVYSRGAILGLVVGIAVLGFYISVRLDLPLGPTDVAFGCAVIFAVYLVQALVRRGDREPAHQAPL